MIDSVDAELFLSNHSTVCGGVEDAQPHLQIASHLVAGSEVGESDVYVVTILVLRLFFGFLP